jgi:hypothetical protein
VQKKIDEIKELYPDVELKPIDNSVDFTVGNYEAAIHTLFEGAALAVIIVFLFLRDIRATVIAAVSLPLSIFPAFWVLDLLGFSLNLVSFLALTLSTGILVDDAIVEIENIVRHMRGNRPTRLRSTPPTRSARRHRHQPDHRRDLAPSFMPGIAGQFFKQFGITVSVQVLFAAGGATHHADAGRHFLRHHTIVGGRRLMMRLCAARHLVGSALPGHRRDRPDVVCGIDLSRDCCPKDSAGPGRVQVPPRHRAATWFPAFRH